MASKNLRILGIHGLGDHRNTTWQADWEAALRTAIPGQDRVDLEFSFLTYDPIFEDVDISAWETAEALWKLTRSGIGSIFGRGRGIIGDVSDRIKWTAGYVVAWVSDDGFQKQTRNLLLNHIANLDTGPDIIAAHSLGSLITYNAFTHRDAEKAAVSSKLKRANYITLGSQIGNPFVVRNLTPGRIEPVPVKNWYHLYNEEDDVFTAPIRIWEANNFQQVDTTFDIDGFADHSAIEYFKHANTVASVWRPIVETAVNHRSFGPRAVSRRRQTKSENRLSRRALLVGINDYPNEADRLEGCVNDVYQMSAVLQECGFPPESIRVCLNERATAKGITERMDWLLDDPQSNDERVFYYSGHGATIPEYGELNEPDRLMETLVPCDFDWSPETAITDDRIYDLYSQLPYETRLAIIFDCCHSGGIHRDGGARPRGITPPDDIRHREIKWDIGSQMWVARDYQPLNKKFSSDQVCNKDYFGESGSKVRLGRATMLRGQSESEYKASIKKAKSTHIGPYLPLIMQACAENELAYEYRHGVVSYGAFTYALTSRLRHYQRITFDRLVEETRDQLRDLGYEQTPQILGPGKVTDSLVPWLMRGE